MPIYIYIYQAFAGLDVRGPARAEAMYARWVQRLATKEYVGELVVMCAALKVAVNLTIIPFSPPQALGERAVARCGPEGPSDTLLLGNTDVRYVLLSRAS